MKIIPAIDLLKGKCVRLKQGNYEKETIFSENPSEMAQKFEENGAKWLHVVDLDGAKMGMPVNIFEIKKIVENVNIRVELGGGIRNLEDIETALNLGVKRIILGTVAIEDPEFVKEAAGEFPGQIVVGIDARNGKAAVRGWKETSEIDAEELALRMGDYGITTIIYTDISKDGMMSGIDAEKMGEMARKSGLKVIASGGVSTLEDIRNLKKYEADGVEGAIIGKAIYTGAIDLREAIKIAEE